jgi:hypothetical protein
VALGKGALISPRKYGLNGTIPAFTRSKFGSFKTSDAEGTTVCVSPKELPFSKKLSQRFRISAEFTLF